MKHIGIQTPCSENWNEMTPSEKGAFCQKCASHVHDFTQKSTREVKETLRSLIGQPVCGRMTADQEMALNVEFETWQFQSKHQFQRALVFSLVVVFGLTLFSCSNEQDKKNVREIQETALQAMNNLSVGELNNVPVDIVASNFSEVQLPVFYEENQLEQYMIEASRPILLVEENPDITMVIDRNYYLGGVGYSTDYIEYLVSEKPIVEERDETGRLIPTKFASLVFPNPATTETMFELAVPVTNQFEISLYDMNGKFIQSIYKGEIQRGTFQQQINLADLNPGIYLVTIFSKDYKETVRISKI
ncbi:MAG: T9SS type A sorting domain-containing protein [Fluviicola sp.]|nr:T9SS type A sorting domain-containing protein [Fluviicola sp.]